MINKLLPLQLVLLIALWAIIQVSSAFTSPNTPATNGEGSTTDTVLYVSPAGNGTEFSVCKPGTLLDAQIRIRTLNANMNHNLTVALYGGVYALNQPLQFTESDGGKNGYKVIYKPVTASDVPVLEGGKRVSGWSQFNDHIWVADLSGSVADCRQFWVNGNRRERASSNRLYTVTLWDDPDTGQGWDGVTAPAGAIDRYSNLDDVELQFNHYWRNSHIPITEVVHNGTSYNIRMNLKNATNTFGPVDNDAVYRVVNAFELLDQAGEWYFNRQTKKLYYYPPVGENLSAAEAYVGALDRIVDFRGSSLANKVTNIRLEGLTMRHNTWLWPNDAVWGYSPLQSETLYYYDNDLGREWLMQMPGVIVANRSNGLELVNNRLVESGAGGIIMAGQGVVHTLIEGNLIRDMSGAGVVLSNHFHVFIDEGRILKDDLFADTRDNVPAGLEAPCVGNIIRNNYINRVGVEYKASVGIQAYYPQNTEISYNEITTLPYTGISLGWGWDYAVADPVNRNNHIHHNRVGDYMRVLIDGGAIYTNGNQVNTEINNNYFYDQNPQSWHQYEAGAIYPDQGSININFHDNVLQNINNWLHLVSNTVINNRFERIYSTSDKEQNVGQTTNVFLNNQLGIIDLPTEAQAIVSTAGLTTNYSFLRSIADNPASVSSFSLANCSSCSLAANVTQSDCLGKTASINARDYFTLTANPTITQGTVTNDTYELIVDGTVRGVGHYGTPEIIGATNRQFRADNGSTYAIVVRDRANLSCAASLTTTPTAPCSTIVVPPVQGNCGLKIDQFDQSVCFTNGSASVTDDYYRLTVKATATNSTTPFLYEVVVNAATDGTGGTVLNGTGTLFGKPVVVSRKDVFKADGQTNQAITFRDKANPACFVTIRTLPVLSCSQP